MKPHDKIKSLLIGSFNPKQIDGILKYYMQAIEKYHEGDWEGVALKGGKFVESLTKALMIYCGISLPRQRAFKAGTVLKNLEQTDASRYDDVIRIVIPKAGILIYEIVNNRGGRHDADDIDPNSMDSEIILPTMSWILAEMVRFANKGKSTDQARDTIQSLTRKTYHSFEEIDGRPYTNINDLDASSTAILLLYYKYPARISRKDLIGFVERHGFKNNAASVAVHRIKSFVDDDNGNFKLRSTGVQRAEEILKEA